MTRLPSKRWMTCDYSLTSDWGGFFGPWWKEWSLSLPASPTLERPPNRLPKSRPLYAFSLIWKSESPVFTLPVCYRIFTAKWQKALESIKRQAGLSLISRRHPIGDYLSALKNDAIVLQNAWHRGTRPASLAWSRRLGCINLLSSRADQTHPFAECDAVLLRPAHKGCIVNPTNNPARGLSDSPSRA